MTTFNLAIQIGDLADDPAPIEYSRFGVAELPAVLEVVDSWTDRDGNPREQTNRIPVTFRRHDAEIVHDSCRRGSRIHVAGPLVFDPDAPGGKSIAVRRLLLIDGDPAVSDRREPR